MIATESTQSTTTLHLPRASILGVRVSAINLAQAVSVIDGWIQRGEHHYVCLANVHGIVEAQQDPELREIYNRAGLTTPDGMPLVWLSRLQGFAGCERVYGPDLMLAMCAHSVQRGYRHFFWGGAPGVAEKLAETLSQRFPGMRIVGTISPPFRDAVEIETAPALETLNRSQANIIWVGLGAPKQEKWMAKQLGKLNANVLIGVGAAFDFHSGRKLQAPRWMQKNGFEWLYRFATEPRRLGPRYLKTNPRFIAMVLSEMLKSKHRAKAGER